MRCSRKLSELGFVIPNENEGSLFDAADYAYNLCDPNFVSEIPRSTRDDNHQIMAKSITVGRCPRLT
jgi:hypothetical protein